MSDLATIRDLHAKAEARANRFEQQYLAARTECDELATTLRVLERLANGGDGGKIAASPSHTAASILAILGPGKANAKPPRDVTQALQLIDSPINADTVRTQLWRMAERKTIMKTDDGRYYLPETTTAPDTEVPRADMGPGDGSRGAPTQPSPEGSIPSGSTPSRRPTAFDANLDDDVPF